MLFRRFSQNRKKNAQTPNVNMHVFLWQQNITGHKIYFADNNK